MVTWLVQPSRVARSQGQGCDGAWALNPAVVAHEPLEATRPDDAPGEDDDEVFPLLKNVIALLVAMWIGWLGQSGLIAGTGFTLPAYIGAMLVAALIRNIDDAIRLVRALAPRAGFDRCHRAVAVPRRWR